MVGFTQTVNGMTGASEWDPVDDDYDYHQEIARSGFADMLHDYERNDKYFSALKMAIDKMHDRGKPANVLDIGTGTGLLSIMAAQCGADSIIACEAFAPMADCALKIIQNNGLSDKIRLIPKRSTELTVGPGCDMETKQNILVTEVFDTELIGEGAIETFRHAHRELLESDCIVVPDSATVYVQIVECPFLQSWNKLEDIVEENVSILIPPQIKKCPGSAAVHDIQLSELSYDSFKSLSEPIAVFNFDWSGKLNIPNNETKYSKIKCLKSGVAQMVFLWWDLQMDTEGEIILSCAPWWAHPDVDKRFQYPQDSIPWRDHWMQAIYYFSNDSPALKDDHLTLMSSHDEYSLWFDIVDDENNPKINSHPVCDCGVHMSLSRTHISYMNDNEKCKPIINSLKDQINKDSICLCLNGGSLMGLVAVNVGAHRVIYIESSIVARKVLADIITYNRLNSAISIYSDLQSVPKRDLESINLVIGDPHFNSALLPWDNLRIGYLISKLNAHNSGFKVIPISCDVWVMAVEFLNLHKIKKPLGIYRGIDYRIFDDLIKSSRLKADDEIEPQPLWEYPCICKSAPIHIGKINFDDFSKLSGSFEGEASCKNEAAYNGFVFWLDWNTGPGKSNIVKTGPLVNPKFNDRIIWDPHTRQAVKILENNEVCQIGSLLNYAFSYDFEKGIVSTNVDIRCPNIK